MTRFSISLALSTAILAACTDSSDPVSSAADIEDSSVLTEQFGTIDERQLDPVSTDTDRQALIGGYNRFSLEAYRALAAGAPAENAIMSGYSLATALTLTMSGTAGTSRDALATLLNLDTLSVESVDAVANAVDLLLDSRNNEQLMLRSANRLFVTQDATFNQPFLDNAVANYGTPVTTADFLNDGPAIVEDINAWVNTQTDGLIPMLLDRIDENTIVAILNAILLDATWNDEFNDIGNRDFTTLDGSTVAVPYFGNRESYRASVENQQTAIDIPYAGSDLSMLIIMPTDLAILEQSLTPETIADVVSGLSTQQVIASIPEWTVEQTIDAKELLTPLGLPSGNMDFSAMLADGSINQRVAITRAIQKARIEVDKDGTRAAAATVVDVGTTSVPVNPISIILNRPFWYAIRDRETGLLLFTGRVVSPAEGA